MPTPTDTRPTLPAGWNDTRAEYPSDRCMHELFEDRVRATPHATALTYGDACMTYGELDRRANQLARHLRRLGVGRDVLVGICMQRSFEMIVGILGTLKAGGAYVPLDPAYPPKRLAAMLGDVELRVLLTSRALAAGLPPHAARPLCLDAEWDRVSAERADAPGYDVSVHDVAYCIFTSGSTGKAKAAAVLHRGWMNLVHWFVDEFDVTASDRVLLVSSFSFDITQRSIVMPLIRGAQLHLHAPALFDPALVADTLARERITVVNCAPSMFYPVLESCDHSYAKLRSLRILFLGGEAISASRLREWAESPECRTEVANVYGAAECSDVSSFYRLKDYPRYAATSVPIGRPIFNSQIHLLDETLQPVPAGSTGEICIGGDGVGKGYINDAALTAEKFVADPFSAAPGARLYRTGDLGRLLPDGTLEFQGRVDHQVKVRGFRIDLGDIETALRQDDRVREAVVLSQEFGATDHRLIAYVVPKPHGSPHEHLAGQLRAHLSESLPEYMLPNDIVLLADMPLNPNGKIDRDALRSAAAGGTSIRVGAEAPRTAMEGEIAAIFAQVLKLERVGLFDNFFDLGGTSYLVTEALGELSDRLEAKVSIFDFLAAPTVAGLAGHIEAGAENA